MLFKRFTAFLLAAVLLFSLMTFTAFAVGGAARTEELPADSTDSTDSTASEPVEWTNPFTDVAQDKWYYDAVKYTNEKGLIKGVEDTLFVPNGTMTRAMLITVLWRHAGSPEGDTCPFSDVQADRWYTKAVSWAYAAGVADGVGGNQFAPNADVTREQTAVMLCRFAKQQNENVDVNADLSAYSDNYAVSSWAAQAVQWAVNKGLLRGINNDGTVCLQPRANATRAQLAVILLRFLQPEAVTVVSEQIKFGTSGSGAFPLTAYKIGDGKNVMVLTFALHGWEDNFDRDGEELVYLADSLKEKLLENYEQVANNDWTVYIVRCANPDGLYLGTSCNGPGRCTVTRYDDSGKLIHTDFGIDINRGFPYCYSQMKTQRNFNGTAPLQCSEARALAAFVENVRGEGCNICIDTHGWTQQIITSSGKSAIYRAFASQFPVNSYASLAYASGYFSAWAAYEKGYDSCLFEFPWNVTSHEGFVSSGYIEKYETVILQLLAGYYKTNNITTKSAGSMLDGN